MNSKQITGLVVGAIAAIILLWWVFAGIGVRNAEAGLRAQFSAVQKANTVDYDAMWKIISQTAQVPQQYSEDFKSAYTSILSAGGPSNDSAVKNLFAVAAGMRVPQLDASIYRKVQDVVESERTKFANAQKQLLDIKREHDKLRTTFPGYLFVGGATPLEAKLVTSSKTEKAFETGKDDDTKVFAK